MKYSLLAVLVMSTASLPVSAAGDEEMIELAWKRGCFNCHDVDRTVRGPAWRDVAERYRGDTSAEDALFVKVRDGSSGNWGDDRMSANRRVPEEDIRALLSWLLALEPAAKQQEDMGK
jgi:cytochrome c